MTKKTKMFEDKMFMKGFNFGINFAVISMREYTKKLQKDLKDLEKMRDSFDQR